MRRSSEADGAISTNPLILTSEGVIWIAVTLLLGVVGWYKSISLVLLLAYLMFALLLLNGVLARAQARRVLAQRTPTPPVFAGEETAITVNVTNTGKQNATVLVKDQVGSEQANWLVHRLTGGEAIACTTRLRLRTRGLFAATPVRVGSAFPLGLIQYEKAGGPGAELVVLPAPGVADPDTLRRWILRYAGGDGRARKVLRRATTDQADVRGIRPYRPGDAIRNIHWRSSARRRELMVREYDTAPAPDLIMIVEPWLPVNPLPQHRENLEAALSLAVTIARTWSRVYRTRITCAIAGDPESICTSASTDEGIREALTPLAGVVGANSFAPLEPRDFGRSLAIAARVLVSSRQASPHANILARSLGRPFVTICAADRLPWYEPPARVREDETSKQTAVTSNQ
jgi:uncharacterized protein (DUF58 family)